jgi:poly(A) polymerase
MTGKLDPKREGWMSAPETHRLLEALSAGKDGARFVGGAVRDALLRREVRDIDVATPLVPDEVTKRLETAGIRAVPTGIEHGTVTAIVDGRAYEVTTLRRDVATDGRHATVAFTTDWKEDASRRDFTINALSAAPDGEIFDYFGGLADLESGRVRFIGDPTQRIREDFLRILRLFRFHAWYAEGPVDPDALRATAAEKAGLAQLSGERIQREMLKLLEAENPVPALRTMAAAGILQGVLPGDLFVPRLERLVAIDSEAFFPADALLRLAALLPGTPDAVKAVSERWKLSGLQQRRLEDIAASREKIVSYLSVREMRKLLYRLGPQLFKDLVFLRWADDPKASNAVRWRTLLAQADAWERPNFPLSGRDVMLAGVPEGPLIGRILSEVEEWWVDADFIEDEFSLAERLKAVVQATAY